MREVFWLEKNRIAGRCGPVEIGWSLPELKAGGIDSILTLGEGVCHPGEIAAEGMNHRIVPLPETVPPAPGDEDRCISLLPSGLAFILMELGRDRTVLIHCHAGKDRTCLMMAYFLTTTYGESTEQTMTAVRKIRSVAFESTGWAEMSKRIINRLTNDSSST